MSSLSQSAGSLDSLPLNRVETGHMRQAKAGLNNVEIPEIPLQMAKVQLGRAFRDSVKRSDAAFKEFGDRGQMSRICAGDEREIPNWLARAWARPETRKQLVMALASESGF